MVSISPEPVPWLQSPMQLKLKFLCQRLNKHSGMRRYHLFSLTEDEYIYGQKKYPSALARHLKSAHKLILMNTLADYVLHTRGLSIKGTV